MNVFTARQAQIGESYLIHEKTRLICGGKIFYILKSHYPFFQLKVVRKLGQGILFLKSNLG